MNNIEKIRQEIEFLKELNEGLYTEGDNSYYEGHDNACNHILAFIDSLPEETCKESLQVQETCKENTDSFTNLEEAAKNYADGQIPTDYPEYFCRQDIKDAFIAGAKWGIKSQEKKIDDAYEKGKQEGIRVIRSWESSPGQGGY